MRCQPRPLTRGHASRPGCRGPAQPRPAQPAPALGATLPHGEDRMCKMTIINTKKSGDQAFCAYEPGQRAQETWPVIPPAGCPVVVSQCTRQMTRVPGRRFKVPGGSLQVANPGPGGLLPGAQPPWWGSKATGRCSDVQSASSPWKPASSLCPTLRVECPSRSQILHFLCQPSGCLTATPFSTRVPCPPR